MLDKKFINAEILEINPQAFKLTINYNYYGMYSYANAYVYKTELECVYRLVLERCNNQLRICKTDGTEKKINPGKG